MRYYKKRIFIQYTNGDIINIADFLSMVYMTYTGTNEQEGVTQYKLSEDRHAITIWKNDDIDTFIRIT